MTIFCKFQSLMIKRQINGKKNFFLNVNRFKNLHIPSVRKDDDNITKMDTYFTALYEIDLLYNDPEDTLDNVNGRRHGTDII